MGEYFRGWRRKIGLVTLSVACMLCVFWLRSDSTLDMLWTGIGSKWLQSTVSIAFDSGPGMTQSSLSFRTKLKDDYPGFGPFFHWTTQSTKVAVRGPILDDKAPWRWRSKGFDIGYQHIEGRFAVDTFAVIVPHWSLVLPLTALSAWLLLSKQRPLKAIETPTDQVT